MKTELSQDKISKEYVGLAIIPFEKKYKQDVIEIITGIQRNEFHVPISLADQPDLEDIQAAYIEAGGNFWIALVNGEVAGTIALTRLDEANGALRKMFVREEFRGKVHGVGQALLETLEAWASERGIRTIYLGTTEQFVGAHRFYEKNGFVEVPRNSLPAGFPVAKVDVKFYCLDMKQQPGA